MASMPPPDIIVIAKRDTSGRIYGFELAPSGTQFYTPRQVDESGQGEDANFQDAILATVSVTDPRNQASAVAAAKKLLTAISKLKNDLIGKENLYVVVHGRTYSVASLIESLGNTQFIITDQSNFNNAGVGAATYNPGGQNTDVINFQSILSGYGADSYQNQEGLTALLLHELAHLTALTDQFRQLSVNLWSSEPPARRGANFYTTEYATNLEALTNDVMLAIAAAASLDITTSVGPVIPGGYQNAVEPSAIFGMRAS